MLKEDVLAALRRAGGGPLSGEELSRTLGVSRAAVWKAVTALRSAGYQIEGQSARGYALVSSPDVLDPAVLRRPDRVVGCEAICLDSVDSTNNEIKRRAIQGAPTGLAVTAEEQTGGKGRRGRSFQSLAGKGLYLSVLLRPQVPVEQVSQLTAWTAVAVARAIEAVSEVRPNIKWPNDVLVNGKKLCGILTELGVEAETGAVSYVVVGMGTNVSQTEADFGPELSEIATSLGILGARVRRSELAKALLSELDAMNAAFPAGRAGYLAEYRRRCVTLGREVKLVAPEGERLATALDVDDNFALRVRLADGTEETVSSGEVSVRGVLGYH